jgi:hypothetical protein
MARKREKHSHRRQGITVASKSVKKSAKKSTKKVDRKAVEAKLKKQVQQARQALAKEKARAKKLADKAKDALKKETAKAKRTTAKTVDAVQKSGRDVSRKAKDLVEAASAKTAAPTKTPTPAKAPTRAPIPPRTTARTGGAAPRTVRPRTPRASAATTPSESWTLPQLRAKAREDGLVGYSRLGKAALLERLRAR